MRQKALLFLIFSMTYSILLALFYWRYHSNFLNYIMAGTLFGLIMTIALSLIQYIVMKAKGIQGKARVVCSTTFLVKGTQSEIFELCRDSIKAIKNCKLGFYDPEEGFIRARTASTWNKFWGEEITFRMKEIDPETFQLFITSRPELRTVIIDYGVNRDHMNRLKEFFLTEKQGDIKVISGI